MVCPPVQGDIARALACGLSHVQADINGITIFYHLLQCRPCSLGDYTMPKLVREHAGTDPEGGGGGRLRQMVWTSLDNHGVKYWY